PRADRHARADDSAGGDRRGVGRAVGAARPGLGHRQRARRHGDAQRARTARRAVRLPGAAQGDHRRPGQLLARIARLRGGAAERSGPAARCLAPTRRGIAISPVIETLRRLVAFDTVSANPNAALIDWAAGRLRDCGARVEVQSGDEPGKANLFATIGPDDRPGLMLSGHSDVVPVAGQAWSSDPFVLTE